METTGKKFKPAELALVLTFCIVLGALSVLFFALPKHPGEMSKLLFRPLAADPFKGRSAQRITGDLVSGKLSSNVDSFLEDHYPAHEFFIALNSYYLRLTGRNANQPVIWGRNGRLFEEPLPAQTDQLDKNIKLIDSFAKANGLRCCFAAVPYANTVCTDSVPAVMPEYHDAEFIARIRERSGAYAPDLIAAYSAEPDPEKLFYRTDHHWTMEGAYICYADICRQLGLEPVSRDTFEVQGYDYNGTFYREAGLWLTKPDTLEIWTNPQLENAKVTIGYDTFAVEHTGVYDKSKLVEGEVDRYAAYLYSNNGLTIIENPEGNGETVMIVKDSYGNSIAPLFVMNYSRVIMIDTRGTYYSSFMLPDPSALVKEYNVKDLIVVLGMKSAVTDSDLYRLK